MTTLSGKEADKFIKRMIKIEKSPISEKDKKLAREVKGNAAYWDEFDKEVKSENQKLENWMIENFGPRCPDYEKDCVVCEKWKLYDQLKMEV